MEASARRSGPPLCGGIGVSDDGVSAVVELEPARAGAGLAAVSGPAPDGADACGCAPSGLRLIQYTTTNTTRRAARMTICFRSAPILAGISFIPHLPAA